MTAIADTPFAGLDTEGRLLKPILSADTHVAGRFGYRGDISYDGPETFMKEVFSISERGKPAIGFLAGSIKEYETLPKLVETFGAAFNGDGKYFIYIADLPQGNRFYIRFGDVKIGAVARLVGIEVGVVSGVFNLESPGVSALGWRLRHEEAYHAS
jgi:hypothetical protein